MIDDAVLEDLFRSAGDSVPVPPGGPQAIRVARDHIVAGARAESPRGRQDGRSYRGVRAAAAAIVLTVAAVAALHHSGQTTSHSATASIKRAALPASDGAGSGASSGSGPATRSLSSSGTPPLKSQGSATGAAAPSSGSSGSGGSASSGSSPNEVPGLPTKVIETGSVSLRVPTGQVGSVMGHLTDLAAAEGGFVADSSTNAAAPSSGTGASGTITIRVPVARFSNLLDGVRASGTVLSVTTSGQDVTSQYVDLQARIQSLEDSRSQFEIILGRAYSIGDILSVEDQISDLQTQIEQLQGQLQVLDDQTSYSTLTVQVTEATKPAVFVPPPKAPSGLSKAWARARHSFSRGIEGAIAASGGIAVFLIFAAVVGVAGRITWLRLRRYLV